jgi:hypothetical protein
MVLLCQAALPRVRHPVPRLCPQVPPLLEMAGLPLLLPARATLRSFMVALLHSVPVHPALLANLVAPWACRRVLATMVALSSSAALWASRRVVALWM